MYIYVMYISIILNGMEEKLSLLIWFVEYTSQTSDVNREPLNSCLWTLKTLFGKIFK